MEASPESALFLPNYSAVELAFFAAHSSDKAPTALPGLDLAINMFGPTSDMREIEDCYLSTTDEIREIRKQEIIDAIQELASSDELDPGTFGARALLLVLKTT